MHHARLFFLLRVVMYYIIFDLEWNNAYNYKTRKGMNEIIEIGAIKLDEKLNIVDSFKQLVKPRISKKLTGRFQNLTHITIDEVKKHGTDFNTAFNDFARWSEREKSIFMSWSNSDLYVLVDNFKVFRNTTNIDFMKRYVDLQKYCMSFLPKNEQANQISLPNCAERFDIDTQLEGLHRALADCSLAARCFKKMFDSVSFSEFVQDCDDDYFERLVYKSHYLSDMNSKELSVLNESFFCPVCNQKLKISKPFYFLNNTFRNIGSCTSCKKKYCIYVRAKKTYDDVLISRKIVPIKKKNVNKTNTDNS